MKTATVTVPEYDAFYLAAARTGYRLTADGMEYVEREALHTGDTVLEGNVITLQTHSYADAIPADGALEYREGYQFTVSGAEKNADGTYTVTGDGAVVIEAVRATRRKSWLTFADTGWYTGKETAYTLTTAQQLAGLAKLVSEQGISFAGVTIRLGNDISLASIDGSSGSCTWTAIGPSLQKPFSGTFDGQGHTIFAMEAYNTGSYAALFGCCVDARIEDLTVCGSAAGEARASYAAGLVSYAKGCAIKNISVYVDVTAAGTHAGGVAAYICDGTAMQSCFSHGSVSGKSGVGGIVGLCYSASDTLTGCANFGAVTGSGAGAYGTGGIAGRLAGVMTKCANYGAVGGADRYTGGLAGYTTARNKTTILASKNEAAVSSSNTETRAATGAIVGNAQNLIWGGCTAAGGSLPQLGRSGKVSEKTTAETCPDYTAGEAPQDADLPESFTVTFLANGETVAVVTGRKGDRSVKAPELPQLAGYTAAWPAFTPTGRDMTITAVYRQNLVSGGRVTKSGTYFIPWLASGEITIAGGLAEDAYLQDVLTCTAAGIMTGTGQDRFSPEKPMTRAMLVTVLWRMAGSPTAQGNGGFTDLRADWYRQAAVWGAQNGIVSGTSRTTFAPDKAVTKEQACALLARFARTRGVQAAADAAPVYVAECSAWAGSDVQSAYALGIVGSYAACLAAPQVSATRAELAHMLSDLLQRV